MGTKYRFIELFFIKVQIFQMFCIKIWGTVLTNCPGGEIFPEPKKKSGAGEKWLGPTTLVIRIVLSGNIWQELEPEPK